MVCSCGVVSKGCYICACNIKHLNFGVYFGIERERCLFIEWVWSIRANTGCHEHQRSKVALMNIQTSKCDSYREKFLLTVRDHIQVCVSMLVNVCMSIERPL